MSENEEKTTALFQPVSSPDVSAQETDYNIPVSIGERGTTYIEERREDSDNAIIKKFGDKTLRDVFINNLPDYAVINCQPPLDFVSDRVELKYQIDIEGDNSTALSKNLRNPSMPFSSTNPMILKLSSAILSNQVIQRHNNRQGASLYDKTMSKIRLPVYVHRVCVSDVLAEGFSSNLSLMMISSTRRSIFDFFKSKPNKDPNETVQSPLVNYGYHAPADLEFLSDVQKILLPKGLLSDVNPSSSSSAKSQTAILSSHETISRQFSDKEKTMLIRQSALRQMIDRSDVALLSLAPGADQASIIKAEKTAAEDEWTSLQNKLFPPTITITPAATTIIVKRSDDKERDPYSASYDRYLQGNHRPFFYTEQNAYINYFCDQMATFVPGEKKFDIVTFSDESLVANCGLHITTLKGYKDTCHRVMYSGGKIEDALKIINDPSSGKTARLNALAYIDKAQKYFATDLTELTMKDLYNTFKIPAPHHPKDYSRIYLPLPEKDAQGKDRYKAPTVLAQLGILRLNSSLTNESKKTLNEAERRDRFVVRNEVGEFVNPSDVRIATHFWLERQEFYTTLKLLSELLRKEEQIADLHSIQLLVFPSHSKQRKENILKIGDKTIYEEPIRLSFSMHLTVTVLGM